MDLGFETIGNATLICHDRGPLLATAVAALAYRLLYLHQLRDTPAFLSPALDAAAHLEWARGFLDGTWPGGEPFFRAPGYVLALAGTLGVCGNDPERVAPLQLLAGIVFAVGGSSGCTGPATASGAAPAPSRAFGADSEVTRLSNEAYADVAVIAEPLSAVWPRVRVAYDLLEIPIEHLDPARYQLGNANFRPNRIGGERLSRYLVCGQGSTARKTADTDAVTMSVITMLTRGEEPDQTLVATLVQATGKARATSSRPVNCASTGRLETVIAEMIGKG